MGARADSLSAKDFGRICKLIYERCGIRLNDDKKIMLEGRLKRRMAKLEMESYSDYCDYVFSGHSQHREEVVHLIDVVTTNKTDFFREKAHFDFLVAKALPELISQRRDGREIVVWSAGCSTGEEPYTLAIVLSEFERAHPGFRFRILATDISTEVLSKAKQGVYKSEVVQPVPPDLRRKYFLRSRNRESGLMRVVPELRERVEFSRLNLVDNFSFSEPSDAIFCRNVIIYFDRATQERLFQRLIAQLVGGGYIFVGHSESLHHMDLPLTPVAPALFRKTYARRRA
jgi:chemotaxis protein methyltransferase CheR